MQYSGKQKYTLKEKYPKTSALKQYIALSEKVKFVPNEAKKREVRAKTADAAIALALVNSRNEVDVNKLQAPGLELNRCIASNFISKITF